MSGEFNFRSIMIKMKLSQISNLYSYFQPQNLSSRSSCLHPHLQPPPRFIEELKAAIYIYFLSYFTRVQNADTKTKFPFEMKSTKDAIS